MNQVQSSFHGSDIEVIAKKYNRNPAEIIPFGSNVNPLGISPLAREALMEQIDAICAYPERDYATLKKNIASYCQVEPEALVLGNGTSELIRLAMNKLQPKKTMIIGPTYSEYAIAAKMAGSETETYMLSHLDDFEFDATRFLNILDGSYDLLVLCNPNNPTSKCIKKPQLEEVLEQCKDYNIQVLIDETYIEFVQNMEQITAVPLTSEFDNIIVLRSVSKFFAAPGLRLGYAVTKNGNFLREASNDAAPWNINAYATVASVMFSDEHYMNLTKSLIQSERNLIYSALSARKTIQLFKPEANFILIKLLKEDITASDVFEHCIKKGLLIRDCTDYEGLGDKYIRFCFLKPEQNDAVVSAILEVV